MADDEGRTPLLIAVNRNINVRPTDLLLQSGIAKPYWVERGQLPGITYR
jgi:hypothetical protein